ncbi:MAG TPA: hypothetical protein VIN59_07725 [Alphaproteobacteria bacterium]
MSSAALRAFNVKVQKATLIPTGEDFPDGACTPIVISNGNIFINTSGRAFKPESFVDFTKRFSACYAKSQHDGVWTIYYSHHGDSMEMVEHLHNKNHLPGHTYSVIKALLSSNDITDKQVGKLFYDYATADDQHAIMTHKSAPTRNASRTFDYAGG